MALDLGTLYYTVEARTSALRRAQKQVREFGNRATNTFSRITGAATSLQGTIAVLAGGAGLGMLAKSFINVASKAEDLQVALDTITKGKGEETFKRLNQWALRMPINTEKAIDSFKQLRAMGLRPTTKDMTTLADAASALGGGTQTFQGISKALGQIATKGKVSAEELMQLAERGVPAYEILQQQLGLTSEQVRNIGNSGIDANKALQALMTGMEERFGGASKRMMQTWSGMMESLRSWTKEFARFVMNSGPFQAMKDSLKQFLNYLESKKGQMNLKQWASETAKGVLTAFETMVNAVGPFVRTLHWVKRTIKGVQFVALGLQDLFLRVVQRITGAFVGMADAINSRINWLIEKFNMLPGVMIPKLPKASQTAAGQFLRGIEQMVDNTDKKVAELTRELTRLSNQNPVPKSWQKKFSQLRGVLDKARDATDRFTQSNDKAKDSSQKLGAGIGQATQKMKEEEKKAQDLIKGMDSLGKVSEQAGQKALKGMNLFSEGSKRAQRDLRRLADESRKLKDLSFDGGSLSSSGEKKKSPDLMALGGPLPVTKREREEWYGGAFADDTQQQTTGWGGSDTSSSTETSTTMPSINITMNNEGLDDPKELADKIEDELTKRFRSGKLRRVIQDIASGRT